MKPLGLIAGFLVLALAPLVVLNMPPEALAQVWLLALTGGVIVWYTWETQQLREESARQTELQLRPFVVVDSVKDDGVYLKNVGIAPALNVRPADLCVSAEQNIWIRFGTALLVLPPDRTERLSATAMEGDRRADIFMAHLDPEFAVLELEVKLRFESLDGCKYQVDQVVRPKGFELRGIRSGPRRISP